MNNEVTTSNATDAKPVVELVNITNEEFALRRRDSLEKRAAPKAEPKAEPKEEPKAETAIEAEPAEKVEEPKTESKESQKEAPKTDAKSKDVLSQVDLSELTDEDIAELAQKGKSGLLKRVAELTVKRKLAEEKAAKLEQYITASHQKPPSLADAKVDNNPYEKIDNAEALTAKYQEVSEVIEWAEDVLDRAENLGGDDIAANVEGKALTKAEVKDALRKARKAHDKYLPAQLKEIQGRERLKAQRFAFDHQARQELSWLEGEDNDLKKTYEAMVSDPRLKKLEETVPELAPQIGYILAHAANSIHGRKQLSLEAPAKPAIKVNPPSSPSSSAAGSDRAEVRGEAKVKETAKKLQETGRAEDFVALRIAQATKRKKL